jgi:putative transcriptional regulator
VDKRNIGREVRESLRAIRAGKGRRWNVTLPLDVRAIREKAGLSTAAFAALMGVSVRTLQDWEQGRRVPRGPALALLRVADRHPEALLG